MGNTGPLQSFSHNSTFIMLYLYHEMEVDYLVVKEMILVSKLFDYNCMFSMGCKPMILQIKDGQNLSKVLKDSCYRLMSHSSLEAFACLEV
jgi:hypothetical protein